MFSNCRAAVLGVEPGNEQGALGNADGFPRYLDKLQVAHGGHGDVGDRGELPETPDRPRSPTSPTTRVMAAHTRKPPTSLTPNFKSPMVHPPRIRIVFRNRPYNRENPYGGARGFVKCLVRGPAGQLARASRPSRISMIREAMAA